MICKQHRDSYLALAILCSLMALSLEAETQRTLFGINGAFNDEAAAQDHHEALWAEYARHLGLTPTELEGFIRKEPQLHNPTEGLKDIGENFSQINGNVGPANKWYQYILKQENSEEIFRWLRENEGSRYRKPHCRDYPMAVYDPPMPASLYSQCEIPFTSHDLDLVKKIQTWIDRINRAAEAGRVVVVGHSQGTRFAENLYGSLDPKWRHRVAFIYVGTPVEEPAPDYVEVVVHDCDIIGDPQLPIDDIQTRGIPVFSGCHGYRNYILGTLSWEGPGKLFDALDSWFAFTPPAPRVKTIRIFEERGPSLNSGYRELGTIECNCSSSEECESNPILDPIFTVDSSPRIAIPILGVSRRPLVMATVEGQNIDSSEMALFIGTCTNPDLSKMQREVFATVDSNGVLGKRQSSGTNDVLTSTLLLRASTPCLATEFAHGVKDVIVKDKQNGNFLCRAFVNFNRFGSIP